MIKSVIFDFFGVLSDDRTRTVLRKLGQEYTPAIHMLAVAFDKNQMPLGEYYKKFAQVTNCDVDQIRCEFERTSDIDEEVLNIVKALHPNYSTALLSNCSTAYIDRFLKEDGFREAFDEVVVSGAVGYVKPEREIFEITLDRLGVQPEEAIFIDDNINNVIGAQEVGIHALQFTSIDTLTNDLERLGILLIGA
jgi:HAD superfamily hydrolase (TIGR01509 family)